MKTFLIICTLLFCYQFSFSQKGNAECNSHGLTGGYYGQILSANLNPIRNTAVLAVGSKSFRTIVTFTNAFGYYHFTALPVCEGYFTQVIGRRYHWPVLLIGITPNEQIGPINIIAMDL